MIKSLKDIGEENLSLYVSKYARKNQGEFYAEMYAKLLNGEQLHPVVKNIMRDIEKGIKRGVVGKAIKAEGLGVKVAKKINIIEPVKVPKDKDITDVIDLISSLTMSGGQPGLAKKKISKEVLEWLQQTVTKKEYKLYRGIGLVKTKVMQHGLDANKIGALKAGQELPKELLKKQIYNPFSSYTKKKSVMNYYSGGELSIKTEVIISKGDILVDLENLDVLLKTTKNKALIEYIKDNLQYFKSDKEVIIIESDIIKPIITDVKGSFRGISRG